MDLFIITYLNHLSIRSRLVSQQNSKLIANSEQLFNATDLLHISFGIILSPNPHSKNSTNSQINQKIQMRIKILKFTLSKYY